MSQANRIPDWIRDPTQLEPVDANELAEVLEQAVQVASGEISAPDPTQFGVTIRDEVDQTETRLQFTDHPMNRVAFWITHQRYQEDPRKAHNMVCRFLGLTRLIASHALEKWVRVDGGAHMVHPAVVVAAATQPLNSFGLFDEEPFIEAVQRIAEEQFPEVDTGRRK